MNEWYGKCTFATNVTLIYTVNYWFPSSRGSISTTVVLLLLLLSVAR